MQDFSVQNNRHLQETFDKIFDCCIKHKQSNVVSIKVGKNLDRKDCQRIVKTISDTITKNITGTFIRDDNKIAYTIQKLRDWDVPFIGNGITINHPNNSMFEARGEFKTNGVGLISEAKNFIIVEAESAPDIDFMKRIQGEIKKARKQLPKNQSNLLHVQLPIHADIDFEQVIDTNYYEIKHRLEQDTTNINAIVLSNSHNLLRNHDYRVPLVQHVVIPNKNSAITMPSQFKHIGTIYIPTINVTAEKELLLHFSFTPHCYWADVPFGQILVCASDPTGRTQVKIWKSHLGKAKFELIQDTVGRKFVEVENLPVIPEQDIIVDIILKERTVNIKLNKTEIIGTM